MSLPAIPTVKTPELVVSNRKARRSQESNQTTPESVPQIQGIQGASKSAIEENSVVKVRVKPSKVLPPSQMARPYKTKIKIVQKNNFDRSQNLVSKKMGCKKYPGHGT